ncbi:hypothetical protein PT974_10171 [Cladobotryum mycophilum]|uniref:Serine/arginine repetitive matrix protein 1 n=1 Tax=Cladobotryum mycophilum TaxID=491253 RepID=A0ABR0SA79_9HYPO
MPQRLLNLAVIASIEFPRYFLPYRTPSLKYDDGEVVRYGAGESWRPTPRGGGGERSPRRVRSPVRERARTPPRVRSPRPRSPIIAGSDSYVPGRYPPRRRSRSGGGVGGGLAVVIVIGESGPEIVKALEDVNELDPPSEDHRHHAEAPREEIRPFERIDMSVRDHRFSEGGHAHPSTVTAVPEEDHIDHDHAPLVDGEVIGTSHTDDLPPRESGISSAMTSRPASERASPRPHSIKARSPPPPLQSATREGSPRPTATATATPIAVREAPKSGEAALAQTKSPPRGPAALRAPPTGPAANRPYPTSVSTPAHSAQRHPQTPSTVPHRPDVSPTNPPSGPRGYVPPSRSSSFATRGGRGGSWSQTGSSRHLSGPPQAPSTPSGPSTIPTGPRATPTSTTVSGTPSLSRPFNPPTGPSAQHAGGPRQTLAQSLLTTMPPIVPGEVEPHYRKLRDEEEKIREELRIKQERLRKSLYTWNRFERDARAWEMRSDLSEKSMKNLAGEGIGGAAF